MENIRLNISIFQTKCILDSKLMEKLQSSLIRIAPVWSKNLEYLNSKGQKASFKLDEPGKFYSELAILVHQRGDLYKKLTEGQVTKRKSRGNIEFKGANGDLILILGIDERPIRRRGLSWAFGNYLTIQVCSAKIESKPNKEWAKNMFLELIDIFEPDYGYACSQDEYESKNINRDGGGYMAIGRDISKYLPGIYWLNFFGSRYENLMGSDVLLKSPSHECIKKPHGVMISLDDDPQKWSSGNYKELQASTLNFIGEEYFFRRDDLSENTKAPDFSELL